VRTREVLRPLWAGLVVGGRDCWLGEADAIGNLLLEEATVGGMVRKLTGAGDDPVDGRRRRRQVNIIPSAFLRAVGGGA
jgi:hypothetical protein